LKVCCCLKLKQRMCFMEKKATESSDRTEENGRYSLLEMDWFIFWVGR
jgi:hypothetical protein